MQELSLNILDIVQNSIKAKASLVEIVIEKTTYNKELVITINDNGCGMTQEQVTHVIDPFYTTRTTRKVGLGVPFFKMSAELTGGDFTIESKVGIGTKIISSYNYEHIDMMPVGDMQATMLSLISVNPHVDFIYKSKIDDTEFVLDTREIKAVLEGIPINSPEILMFIKEQFEES